MSKNWYKSSNIEETYFTPFPAMKAEYVAIGEGKASPTEIAAFMNDPENGEAYLISDSGLAKTYRNEESSEPVELPNGVYRYLDADWAGRPDRLEPMALRDEKYLNFSKIYGQLKKEINTFRASEAKYAAHNMYYKLGLLLYGSPGQSKSASIRELAKEYSKDTIIMWADGTIPSQNFLKAVQNTISDRKKMYILEEIATSHVTYSPAMLSFLDGEDSSKGIVIMTTNYIKSLPNNLLDRPSRVDKLFEFKAPDAEERKSLLEYFLQYPVSEKSIDETKSMSVACIREICANALFKEVGILEAIKEMKLRRLLIKNGLGKSGGSDLGDF